MGDLSDHAPRPAAADARLTGVCVVALTPGRRNGSHEEVTHHRLAERLAALKHLPFYDACDVTGSSARDHYFVPDAMLVSLTGARALGITDADHLFGGVVPYPYIATKTISHPLLGEACARPIGWSTDFSRQVRELVLPGYSAFSFADAQSAGRSLLQDGSVRIKKAGGAGGARPAVASDPRQLQATLQAFGEEGAWFDGVVLERNLVDVVTSSVGQVRVSKLQLSYCGRQQSTLDHRGHRVYGGARLEFVRGDYDSLLRRHDLKAQLRLAVRQARDFQRCAFDCFPGMFASRCHCDVVQGVDDLGRWCSGVVEPSWCVGHASGAEIAALEAFAARPELDTVCASTTELYDLKPNVPRDALVYFSGIDERVGAITKYSRIESAPSTTPW